MNLRRAIPFCLFAFLAILLTGCSAAPNTSHSTVVADAQFSGAVHGGQQPVAGASIQLYAVGTTGNGTASTPLLTSAVTSDANGKFTITGKYTCGSAGFVYAVATGGNPGLSTNNPNIALMAAVGPCGGLNSNTFFNINELTTVAAVSALAPFMTSVTAIGATGSFPASMGAAFGLANEFVNNTTGLSPGTGIPSGYTVPTGEINTLADILSACINSTGGTAGDGSLCGQLFSLTTVGSNPPPTDTIQAMLNLANNPPLNTSALYALLPPTPPFQPTLTSAPANFSLSLQSVAANEANPFAVHSQNVIVSSLSPIRAPYITMNSSGNRS